MRRSAVSASSAAARVLSRSNVLRWLSTGGRVSFLARANVPGRYTIRLTVRSGGKTIVLARGFKTVDRAGRTRILVRSTPGGRAYLRNRFAAEENPRIEAKLVVRFKPTVGRAGVIVSETSLGQ